MPSTSLSLSSIIPSSRQGLPPLNTHDFSIYLSGHSLCWTAITKVCSVNWPFLCPFWSTLFTYISGVLLSLHYKVVLLSSCSHWERGKASDQNTSAKARSSREVFGKSLKALKYECSLKLPGHSYICLMEIILLIKSRKRRNRGWTL